MDVKEWLNRGWELNKEIDQLLESQHKAFAKATKSTATSEGERVQSSAGNSMEHKFINYAAYSEMIDERIDVLYAIKQEILSAVNKINDSTLRTLLIARYINFKTWEQIAYEMSYSYKHVCRLHGKALIKLKDVIECHTASVL